MVDASELSSFAAALLASEASHLDCAVQEGDDVEDGIIIRAVAAPTIDATGVVAGEAAAGTAALAGGGGGNQAWLARMAALRTAKQQQQGQQQQGQQQQL